MRTAASLAAAVWLTACQSPARPETIGAGASVVNTVPGTTIVGAIYNGQPVTSGGGEGCCVSLPLRWQPGMTATIEWTIDPDSERNPDGSLPPRRNPNGSSTPEWRRWMEVHKKNYQHRAATIPVPQYDKVASLVLVFLPCDEVYPLIDTKQHSQVMGNLPGGRLWEPEIVRRLGRTGLCSKS
ncbi:DUF3304 domain-containing protein [Chromobacterium sp. CV08]|uniref:DUF3304 domain-containing protein n=1 Tax=Chromobacterium sp. CV08 TaxID=3133274 RepID=UPI003DA9A821